MRSWVAKREMRKTNKGLGLVIQVLDRWIIRKQYLQVLDPEIFQRKSFTGLGSLNQAFDHLWKKNLHDVGLRNMYSRLSLQPLESRLRINCLRWHGYVEKSEEWIKRWSEIDVYSCQLEVDHINNGQNQ